MTSWKQCLHPHWQGLGYVIVKSVYKYTFLNWQNTKIVKKEKKLEVISILSIWVIQFSQINNIFNFRGLRSREDGWTLPAIGEFDVYVQADVIETLSLNERAKILI